MECFAGVAEYETECVVVEVCGVILACTFTTMKFKSLRICLYYCINKLAAENLLILLSSAHRSNYELRSRADTSIL